MSRLLIVLISGLAIWDGVAFVTGPSDFTGALGVFLKVGAIGSVALAVGGVTIAWLWPGSRPGQLLGWCMALAAFTWIDVTLVPLVPDSLPYTGLLASMGTAGGIIAMIDRVSLALLVAAMARFALLFPRQVNVADHPASRIPPGFPGTRIANKLDGLLFRPLRVPQGRGWGFLPRWLTEEESTTGPSRPPLPFLDWLINRPGQVWLAAVMASAFVSLSLLTDVEWIASVAWAVEYLGLIMLGFAFASGLRLQYSSGGAEDQQRLLWIIEGVAVAGLAYCFWALIFLLTEIGTGQFSVIMDDPGQVLGLPKPTAIYLAVSVLMSPAVFTLLCAIAASAFYRGDVDPRLAIRRTTVYGALGILFVFLFAGLGNVVSEFIETQLGLPGYVGTGVYGGTVAVLLIPVRGWFNRIADRWVPKLHGGGVAPPA